MAELVTKYKQYAEYKDSGLAWLGYMPSHWVLRKSKYLFNRMQRPVRPEDGVITAFRDGQVTLRTNRRTDGFTQSIKEIGYQSVRVGDLLVHAMDGFAGAIGVSDSNGKCSPVCSVCVAVNPDQIYMPYYGYLVRQLAVTDFISSLAKGIRERSTEFRYSEFSALDLVVPTLEEQTKIANFLDYETAQIDTLIEKQQTLIQLLKEKRQAVISHAVTKGLNPDAPMKDSGVEWLGEVPAHWEVGRLKNVLRIRNGRDYKAVEVEAGGYPVYGSGGIFRRSSDYLFDGESVLFGRKGTIDKPLLVSGRFWTVDTMFYSEVFTNSKPEYIHHQATLFPFDMLSTNTALPSMTQEDLLNLGFVIPPIDEQKEICQHLSNKLEVFSSLVNKAEQAIQLMQERRTALISAAVTGKIDVRGWLAPDNA